MARKRKRSRGRSSSGISRRSLLLLTSIGAVAGTGTYLSGAFDSVSSGRGVGVETADEDDSNALLRVDAREPEGNSGDPVTLFDLRNQFGVELTEIEARALDNDNPLKLDAERYLRTPDSLQPRDEGTIEADLSCSTESKENIVVDVEILASGNGQSVELTRPVEVSCIRAFTIEITNIEPINQGKPGKGKPGKGKPGKGKPGKGKPGKGNPDYRVSWSATVPDDTTIDIRLSFDGPGASGEKIVERTGSHDGTEDLIRDSGNPDTIIAEIIQDEIVEASDSRDI